MTEIIRTLSPLGKTYKRHVVLDGVEINLDQGEIMALMGKNGAGKTTLIRLVLGLAFPTAGDLRLFGEKPQSIAGRVGFLSEDVAVYPHLSAAENLRVVAYGNGLSLRSEEIIRTLERFELGKAQAKPARTFSLGMKRRLQLAMAVIGPPKELYVLDEPTNGLDLDGMLWLKDFLRDLRETGASVLVASHAVADLDEVVTRFMILDGGRILRIGAWQGSSATIRGWLVQLQRDQWSSVVNALSESGLSVCEAGDGVEIRNDITFSELSELFAGIQIVPETVAPIRDSLSTVLQQTLGERCETRSF